MTAGVSAHKSLTFICMLSNIYSRLMALMSEPEVSVTPAPAGAAAATSDPAYLPNTTSILSLSANREANELVYGHVGRGTIAIAIYIMPLQEMMVSDQIYTLVILKRLNIV